MCMHWLGFGRALMSVCLFCCHQKLVPILEFIIVFSFLIFPFILFVTLWRKLSQWQDHQGLAAHSVLLDASPHPTNPTPITSGHDFQPTIVSIAFPEIYKENWPWNGSLVVSLTLQHALAILLLGPSCSDENNSAIYLLYCDLWTIPTCSCRYVQMHIVQIVYSFKILIRLLL